MKRKTDVECSSAAVEKSETTRTGTGVAAIKQAVFDNHDYVQGWLSAFGTRSDWYMALPSPTGIS
jgi:hypothetical protein